VDSSLLIIKIQTRGESIRNATIVRNTLSLSLSLGQLLLVSLANAFRLISGTSPLYILLADKIPDRGQ